MCFIRSRQQQWFSTAGPRTSHDPRNFFEPFEQWHAGQDENILSSTDKISAFQKKVAIWKKRIAAGNLEMFPNTPNNCPKIPQLILNHLDTLLINLDKYFPSISVDQYDMVRSPFVEFEPSEEQFTLTEEEEFASVSSDRTLK